MRGVTSRKRPLMVSFSCNIHYLLLLPWVVYPLYRFVVGCSETIWTTRDIGSNVILTTVIPFATIQVPYRIRDIVV